VTFDFLERKQNEYESLRQEIEELKDEAKNLHE